MTDKQPGQLNSDYEQRTQNDSAGRIKKASFFLSFLIIFLPIEFIIVLRSSAYLLNPFIFIGVNWMNAGIFETLVNLGASFFIALLIKLIVASRKYITPVKQIRVQIILTIIVLVIIAAIYLGWIITKQHEEINILNDCRDLTGEEKEECLDIILPPLNSCEHLTGEGKEECLNNISQEYYRLYIFNEPYIDKNSIENAMKRFTVDSCSSYSNDVEERICYYINYKRCEALFVAPEKGESCFNELENYTKGRYFFGYSLPEIINVFNTNNNEKLIDIYNYKYGEYDDENPYVNWREIGLINRGITNIPSAIGQLKSVHSIILRGNEINAIPRELGQLTGLWFLDLSNNNISEIPVELGKIETESRLSISLSNNNITEIPVEIFSIKNLVWLNLEDNKISKAPNSEGPISTNEFILHLRGNPIPKEEMEKFIQLLPNARVSFDGS